MNLSQIPDATYVSFKGKKFLHKACAHAGFCEKCADEINRLNQDGPICRGKINGMVKIFQLYKLSLIYYLFTLLFTTSSIIIIISFLFLL